MPNLLEKEPGSMRVEVANPDERPHRFVLRCEKPGGFMGVNPAWVQPGWENPRL